MNYLPKDLLIELALDLDLPEVIKFCSSSQRINKTICESDVFWSKKFIRDYGDYPKTTKTTETWKEFYKFVTETKPDVLLNLGAEFNIISYVVVGLKRADLNGMNYWMYIETPLTKASQKGYLEIVKYLVEYETNIQRRDRLNRRKALVTQENKNVKQDTRQPIGGRREGGLRLGGMKRDAVLSHGATKYLEDTYSVKYRTKLEVILSIVTTINKENSEVKSYLYKQLF